MTPSEYNIRPMTRADLATAVDWAAAEGWNPGLKDADCYWQADPQGFFMGEVDGTQVSSISVVKYGSSFAFLGFYIVVPSHRGKGYGLGLWRHAMSAAGNRNIGLDGVVDQQDNYKKSGFKPAFRNIRFQGKAMASAGNPPEHGQAGTIVPLNQVPVKEVMAFDRPFFPEDRTRFIKRWIAQPGAIGLGIVKDQDLEGYGLIRECRQGFKIGPLFTHPAQAGQLFDALASLVPPGTDIFLDVPEPNGPGVELARSRGMAPCFETARMYTGAFPDLPLDRIFGITSFEVG